MFFLQLIEGANIPKNICKACLDRLLAANYFRDLLVEANKAYEHLLPEVSKNEENVQDSSKQEPENVSINDIDEQTPVKSENNPVPEVSEPPIQPSSSEKPEQMEANEMDIPGISEESVDIIDLKLEEQVTSTDDAQNEEEIQEVEFYEHNCCMCTFVFTSENDLLDHCRVDHNIEPLRVEPSTEYFPCHLCCSQFGSESDLITHKTCDVCLECFASDADLLEHKKSHELETGIEQVEDVEIQVSEQMEHDGVVEAEEEEVHYVTTLTVSSQKPKVKSKGPSRARNKSEIEDLSRAPKIFPCCLCPTILDTEDDRHTHYQIQHDISPVDTNCPKKQCLYCNKTFDRIDQYYSHYEMPSRKQNRCTKCGRKFLKPEQLKQHDMNIHTTDTPQYTCHACGITFLTSNAYYSHNHRHHTEKPRYECDICFVTLLTPSKLKEHKNIHLNIKEFVCSFCNKGFVRKDNLRNHLRTHTGDRPYSCEYCEKAFSHYTDMKRHR